MKPITCPKHALNMPKDENGWQGYLLTVHRSEEIRDQG